MSLDVHLTEKNKTMTCRHCNSDYVTDDEVYSANITHNLGKMADEAGIYYHLWRPEEVHVTKAKQLILPLSEALQHMKDNPEHYKQFNAPNGWGLYEHFMEFVEKYLEACKTYPEADVEACR